MDTIYRVNEIFTDEETFEVIAKCVDLIYDEEFEKYLGEPDDYLAKENASNLLKDSNFEIPEDVRADIEDIFGVAEFDAENDYESGYQFYDEFDDDVDNFDDELEFVDNRKRAIIGAGDDYGFDEYDVKESFNLREALNRIDISTYNKYDLLNLYESCDLSENEKRALANIVYDQDDPRVIYDTLNDRFVGGKEIEMPKRVKDGVIHEDADGHEVYGSWSVDFDITFEGEETSFDNLSETTQEHIAESIKEGYAQGEIVEAEGTGWWVAKIECYLDNKGDVLFDSLDEASQEHIADSIKDGYTSGELCVWVDGGIDESKSIHEDTDNPNTDVIKDMAVGEERSFSLNNYYKFENFTKFWVKKTDDDNFEIWMSSEDGKDIANHTKFSTLSNTLYWFGLTTVDGGGDIPTEVNEAFGDSQEGYDFAGLNRELRQELPADEIDHYNWDLYVKVSPKSKEILKKYGIHNHPLLSTFIDQITHTRWYDLPFAYAPINDTEVTEGYEFLDGTKVEAYSDYEIAEERAEELGLKMAEYGDYYNSDLSYCYWNKSGNRNDDAQVIVYYKFENGRPRPLTEMERETVMDKYGIDSFDNPALEDDMGTYFDDVQPELEEDFTRVIDWDRVIIDVSILLDDKVLGDKWIEVFPVSTYPTYVRLEITGDDDVTRIASFTAKGNRVEVAFKNGSEALCNSPKEIARFIAGEYGLSIDNKTNEDWSHFTYKSGANPYIATNDKEANKLVKKYGSKCKKVKDGSDGTSYYEIDDLNESDSVDDELETAEQKISSANTSINSSKLPAIFNMVRFNAGTLNLDFGGGKFDNATEFLAQQDVESLVYDPYNRSTEHNKEVLKRVRENGGADTITLSNVLNVIAEPESRLAVLRNCKRLLKSGGTLYITVYEGTGKSDSKETKSGYQLNRKTADYLDEISSVFSDVSRRGKLITAK